MWVPPGDFHDGPGERKPVKEDKKVGKKSIWLEVMIPKEKSKKPTA